MGALQWGRVIVLLSRGPPGEVNVYFCAVACVFKEAAHAGWANGVVEKCGTNQSAALPFSILLAAHRQILLHYSAFQLPAAIYCSAPLAFTVLLPQTVPSFNLLFILERSSRGDSHFQWHGVNYTSKGKEKLQQRDILTEKRQLHNWPIKSHLHALCRVLLQGVSAVTPCFCYATLHWLCLPTVSYWTECILCQILVHSHIKRRTAMGIVG